MKQRAKGGVKASDNIMDAAHMEFKAVKEVSTAQHMNAKFRNSMEDAHVHLDQYGGEPNSAYFAVYDGHGGRDIVEYVEKHLSDVLLKELQSESASRDVRECIESAYLLTDIASSQCGLTESGSTSVSVFMRNEGEKRVIYAANCGDSRAVLCQNGSPIRLTFDHKPTEPEERKRIEEAGGFILRSRVLGMLAVTRSFGDHNLKKFVTARPFTSVHTLDEHSQFLVVACDGLWDVMTDSDVVNFVLEKKGTADFDYKEVAPALLEEALSRGSTDNITIMVVTL